MLINLSRLKGMLGEELWQAAQLLKEKGGVRESDSVADQAVYLVATNPPHRVTLNASGEHYCTCALFQQQRVCVHIAAAALSARQNGTLDRLEHTRARAAAPKLLDTMESAIP